MNQEERRRACLRQRGELPEQESGLPDAEKKKERKVPSYAQGLHGMKGQKAKRRQALLRLGLYAGAVLVIALVILAFTQKQRSSAAGTSDPAAQGSKAGLETGETGGSLQETESEPSQTEETLPESSAEPSATPEETLWQQVWPVSAEIPVDPANIAIPDWVTVDLLPVNGYSRPTTLLDRVEYIAIHWVANPGSTAKGNRDYFANLGDPADPAYASRKASAHFVVGLEGEVVQCIPLNEWAYAVHDVYNPKTISIEVCHPDWDGKFSDVTYQSVVRLAAWLLQQFHLGEDALLRHHDCDGKDCPKYYVEHPDAWEQLKDDIMSYSSAHPSIH